MTTTEQNTAENQAQIDAESRPEAPAVAGTEEDGSDAESGSESHDTEQRPKGNREARYRVERNEAREEARQLQERIDSLLTREAERVAAQHLAEPADLFTLSGKSVRDFVGEDGELDTELVATTANEILGTRPGLSPVARATDRSQGLGGGAQNTGPQWSDVFQP